MKSRPVIRSPRPRTGAAAAPVSLARLLSKRGYCSRTQAEALVVAGRVSVDGRLERDPARRCDPLSARITVDGEAVVRQQYRYVALNKPRGLVTTATDEQGRDTVYRCFEGAGLPWLGPVGRLDKASEGLLLFTNDTRWAAKLLDPAARVPRVYHVQIDRLPDAGLLAALRTGVEAGDERLRAAAVSVLRTGERHAWLAVTLEEGRNRHIRRLLEQLDVATLRLVRIAYGSLELGSLARGRWRHFTPDEVGALGRAGGSRRR